MILYTKCRYLGLLRRRYTKLEGGVERERWELVAEEMRYSIRKAVVKLPERSGRGGNFKGGGGYITNPLILWCPSGDHVVGDRLRAHFPRFSPPIFFFSSSFPLPKTQVCGISTARAYGKTENVSVILNTHPPILNLMRA